MRLIAKTMIKYGDKGETAAPGGTFELDEKKYPSSVESLLRSGDAVKAEKAQAEIQEAKKRQ